MEQWVPEGVAFWNGLTTATVARNLEHWVLGKLERSLLDAVGVPAATVVEDGSVVS